MTGQLKVIPLTKGYETLVDAEDYDALSRHRWHATIRGGRVYAAGRVEGRYVYMHRWLCGDPRGKLTDHINHDTLDNRRANLRVVTASQNQWNTSAVRAKSGYKGVYFCGAEKRKKPWEARIKVFGTPKCLGYYPTAEDAALAYDEAARKHFGPHAFCNFTEVP